MTAPDFDPADIRMDAPGSACAFPNCDCPGDVPVCEDYLVTSSDERLIRLAGGQRCPVHLCPEPCPSCDAYIAAGL